MVDLQYRMHRSRRYEYASSGQGMSDTGTPSKAVQHHPSTRLLLRVLARSLFQPGTTETTVRATVTERLTERRSR